MRFLFPESTGVASEHFEVIENDRATSAVKECWNVMKQSITLTLVHPAGSGESYLDTTVSVISPTR
jgi:hypothetical protein